MRRFLAPSLVLLAAACASTPRPQPAAVVTTPVARPVAGGTVIGLDANDLVRRFGQPAFQVQEGAGTKLQWTGGGCVLDVYLYPPQGGSGAARSTHADARRPSGADLDVASCLALMRR